MIVNRDVVRDWVTLSNERNERYARELGADGMNEVAQVAAELARNFFNSLRDHAPDDELATHVIESAAFGVMHAASQALLFATPPKFDPPNATAN
jgi:hypothetical protein